MNTEFTYKRYVQDKFVMDKYNEYQNKYASTIRESDRVLLSLVADWVNNTNTNTNTNSNSNSGDLSILDVGCSTGNFLLHLKRLTGGRHLKLIGGDLSLSSLEICKSNKELADIDFYVLDITDLPSSSFDIIVVNAVLYVLNDEEYCAALRSLRKALRPGGVIFCFDFAHEFVQEIELLERSLLHPDGHRLCFRSMEKINRSAISAGFSKVEYLPFVLPVDLPKPSDKTDITTYTILNEERTRMAFRGIIYQPWCHIIIHS